MSEHGCIESRLSRMHIPLDGSHVRVSNILASEAICITFFAGLCGLLQWKVFEKLDSGRWEERRWGTCRTIAEVSDVAAVH